MRDLWLSELVVRNENGEAVLDENGRAVRRRHKSARHPDNGGSPKAKRWLAVWTGPDGTEKTKAFARQGDAEPYGIEMGSGLLALCLVPRCRRQASIEPPVLLCQDHRDLLVAQATKRRPYVHDPLGYFVRNGCDQDRLDDESPGSDDVPVASDVCGGGDHSWRSRRGDDDALAVSGVPDWPH